MSYQSEEQHIRAIQCFVAYGDIPLREKGSTTFFLIPFLPLDKRLFYACTRVRPHALWTFRAPGLRDRPCQQPWWIRRGDAVEEDREPAVGRAGFWDAGAAGDAHSTRQPCGNLAQWLEPYFVCCIARFSRHFPLWPPLSPALNSTWRARPMSTLTPMNILM